MSFVRTLATLAIGFAAARGYSKYKEMGGMPGVKEAMRQAGEPGGAVDRWAEQAEKLGVPGGARMVRELYDRFGGAAEATEAGLGSLIAAMTGAAAAGGKAVGEVIEAATAATPVEAISEANARLMIRAMIMAAKADGEVDAEERARIMDHLRDASAEEIAFVEAALDAPLDVAALARETAETLREQIYSASLLAIRVDTEAEQAHLARLGAALGLSDETRARLHAAMGRPAPGA